MSKSLSSSPPVSYLLFILFNQKVIKKPHPNLVNDFLNSRLRVYICFTLVGTEAYYHLKSITTCKLPRSLCVGDPGLLPSRQRPCFYTLISTARWRPGSEANLEIFQRKLKASNLLDPINVNKICSPASWIPLENGCRWFNCIHLTGAFPGSGLCGSNRDVDAALAVWTGDFPWVKR